MKLTITGNVPSQKNRKIISMNRATGRPFLRSAPAVKDWQERAYWELKKQTKGFKVTAYPVTVVCTIYFDNRRRHDLDNAYAGVADALVHAGIIEDDSVAYINVVTLRYGGLDKVNPRVEIIIN